MKITEQFDEFEAALDGVAGLDLKKIDRRKSGFKRAVEAASAVQQATARRQAFYCRSKRTEPSMPRFKCLDDA